MGIVERTKYCPCFWQVILESIEKHFDSIILLIWLNNFIPFWYYINKKTDTWHLKMLCLRNMSDRNNIKKYLRWLKIHWFLSDNLAIWDRD